MLVDGEFCKDLVGFIVFVNLIALVGCFLVGEFFFIVWLIKLFIA